MNIEFVRTTNIPDHYVVLQHLSIYDIHRIKQILEERYESISFPDRQYALYFSFKDKADEAFFLVWSNDGIEI
jgi:hypothetical protein